MTPPTEAEIERVAVAIAIAVAEMRANGMSEMAVQLAETYARDVAVSTYRHAAEAAIIALRSDPH